jgi:hypothetical protein
VARLAHAWRELERERRLAALAAVGLFASMFLPWYSKTDTVVVGGALRHSQTSLNAFQAFSFVEAAVLLVSAGVLALLFARAEQRSFRLPGGDGLIVVIAGGWTALLVFYRLIDKPGLQGNQRITATVGVEWGIFISLLVALGLLYAGRLMRAEAPRASLFGPPRPASAPGAGARVEEHAIPPTHNGDDHEHATTVLPASTGHPAATAAGAERAAERHRPRYPPAPSKQMSFEDPPRE